MRRLTAVAVAAVAATGSAAAPAAAQVAPPRLAAPADCLSNPNCAPGLAEVYGVDVSSVLVPLTVADAGISALDDGLAEVAVAFSTNPQVSRPDILTLRDDRGLAGEDRLVPVARRGLLRAHGRPLRRRLNAVSRLVTTLALRSLNQQVIDGRLPEAVGGEFVDANGLGAQRKRRPGRRIVLGHQDFAEAETVAYLYGAALRAAGYRVEVRSVRGFRAEAVRALRRGRINLYVAYSRSLTEYLDPGARIPDGRVMRPLRRALEPLRSRPLAPAPGENRNLFVMKAAAARQLGIESISDLARHWPRSDQSR
jgi:glycine betaine/choline ABC-type transport system substrate-binding protein